MDDDFSDNSSENPEEKSDDASSENPGDDLTEDESSVSDNTIEDETKDEADKNDEPNETETTDITITVMWDDANNQDGIRPTSITVYLLANGERIASKKVTAEEDWEWSFVDFPKCNDGKEVVYTVEEEPVKRYTSEVEGYNIINKHVPKKPDSKKPEPPKPKDPVITEKVEKTTSVVSTQTVINKEVKPRNTPKAGEDVTMLYVCALAICVVTLLCLKRSKRNKDKDNNE